MKVKLQVPPWRDALGVKVMSWPDRMPMLPGTATVAGVTVPAQSGRKATQTGSPSASAASTTMLTGTFVSGMTLPGVEMLIFVATGALLNAICVTDTSPTGRTVIVNERA